MQEQVNHPQHYGGDNNPYEAIKVIERYELNFHLGNALKYILRAKHKGKEIEDLNKALWYLKRIAKDLPIDLDLKIENIGVLHEEVCKAHGVDKSLFFVVANILAYNRSKLKRSRILQSICFLETYLHRTVS